MQSDFSHLLRGISWEGILEGDKTLSAIELPNSSSAAPDGSSVLADGGAPVAADGASEKVMGGQGGARATGISAPQPLLPQQQMQAMPMGHAGGAYYVNAAQYQPIGLSSPGCGQLQSQQLMFAQPGGQMVYVPMPYYQHAGYQHNSSPQHMYPAPQPHCYHTQILQLQPEGQIMSLMPQHLQQQQPQYFAPAQFPQRGFIASAPPQKVEVSESEFGCVQVFPGTRLPQGTPFFSFGVPPTSHYSVAYAGGNIPKPPEYNSVCVQQSPHIAVRGTEVIAETEHKLAGENLQSHVKPMVS